MGRANKPLYERYVELKNELSRLNGHDDLGDAWRDKYETETFGADVQSLYRDMEPLYLELHAYIRRKVRNLKRIGRCINIERILSFIVTFFTVVQCLRRGEYRSEWNTARPPSRVKLPGILLTLNK